MASSSDTTQPASKVEGLNTDHDLRSSGYATVGTTKSGLSKSTSVFSTSAQTDDQRKIEQLEDRVKRLKRKLEIVDTGDELIDVLLNDNQKLREQVKKRRLSIIETFKEDAELADEVWRLKMANENSADHG